MKKKTTKAPKAKAEPKPKPEPKKRKAPAKKVRCCGRLAMLLACRACAVQA